MTIIGLGSAGCNIAEMFESIEDSHVLLIDSNIEGDNCFSLPEFKTPEEYEYNLPNLKNFLINCHKKVLFILGGSGKVSGATLKILELIKDREISILYIRPDKELLGNIGRMQDKLTFNVLQQYTRSGIFERIYLIDNLCIESIIGEIPVIGYYEALNKLIFNCISFIKFYENKKAIIDNTSEVKDISRISTLGIYDLENDIEKIFYNFDFIDDKCYNFIINENILKSDGKLFKQIKEKMKQKSLNDIKISYKIYSTQNDNNYCYVVQHSRKVQE